MRRRVSKGAQIYSVDLGLDDNHDTEVTVAYTYRTYVQRHGHLLYLDLPRPTKNVHTSLNYAGAGIRRVNALDFIASSRATRIDRSPEELPTKTADIGFDGWVLPRSGVAFVWVLDDELNSSD